MAERENEPPRPVRPADFDSAIAEAVALHRDGRLAEAEARYLHILEGHPEHTGVLHNLGVVAAQGGEPAKALAWFDKTLALNPDYTRAYLNRASAHHELQRLEDAAADYRKFLAAEPDHHNANLRLALVETALGRRDSALAHFARTSEIRRAAATVTSISKLKLDHDIAQFRFLASAGDDADRLSRLADDLTALRDGIDWPDDDGEPVVLTDAQSRTIAAIFARPINVTVAREIAGSSLHPSLDAADITRDYFRHTPGMARVDDLLAPDALQALRRYLLHSTIWYDFNHVRGFLAAYLEDGLACPLLLQIAADLRMKFPGIFGTQPLTQAWAFKCVGGRHSVDVHMDAAAVSVNFWITPDVANLDPDHGGLVLHDTPPPPEWRIAGYDQDIDAIREFLAQAGSARTIVRHRENRAVIFDSNLFHQSDTVDFKPGHENHRINITLLFGQRGG